MTGKTACVRGETTARTGSVAVAKMAGETSPFTAGTEATGAETTGTAIDPIGAWGIDWTSPVTGAEGAAGGASSAGLGTAAAAVGPAISATGTPRLLTLCAAPDTAEPVGGGAEETVPRRDPEPRPVSAVPDEAEKVNQAIAMVPANKRRRTARKVNGDIIAMQHPPMSFASQAAGPDPDCLLANIPATAGNGTSSRYSFVAGSATEGFDKVRTSGPTYGRV